MRQKSAPNPNYIMRQYDEALESIYESGFDIDGDRTGMGTICKFGISTEFDLSTGRVPVLSKRKVAWKSIVKEVLWYISGSHSINKLEEAGAKIWTPWKNDEFTTKHNLPQGSGGYIYGFNLIHFGANIQDVENYEKAKALYQDESRPVFNARGLEANEIAYKDKLGFNQLDYVINTLRNNPKSRQACFTFWRPDTNKQAVLPACHAFYSFIVSPDEEGEMRVLNCHMFQRSADYPIGVGMGNLWTATLFMYMIAQQCNMRVGTLYHSAAHCHIYKSNIDAVKKYIDRSYDFDEPNSPILRIKPRQSIYDYTADDFELEDYDPLPAIKFEPAV